MFGELLLTFGPPKIYNFFSLLQWQWWMRKVGRGGGEKRKERERGWGWWWPYRLVEVVMATVRRERQDQS